ncbi:TldD/PmbA family protein [Endozoicomonas numazuensis]|uniref:Zn-dependent protease n=1 Tax=Endozoicomonas numazuensis TaxID=1137799 RepID=A0A081NFT5_9GAMM|nr:TldD/PmbA family protein [Endozoicomonas numazuensis]KEQ17308.1 Zn-dependent protease [Endozoicomonas numazuensis]
MSEQAKLQKAIEHVLNSVQGQGAEADVIASGSNSFSLKANKGELDEYKVTSGQVIGVRVIKDQRVATSYSESLEPASLDLMIKNALESARFAKVDEHQQISCLNSKISTDMDEIHQPDSVSVDEKIALALSLEQGVVNKPFEPSSPYNGYGESESQLLIANTQGSFCEHKERSFSCYAYTLLEKDGKQSMDGASSCGRSFSELKPQFCIDHGYDLANDLLEGEPVATGSYSVIFEVDALSSLLGAFGLCFSGVGAMKGVNPWREKLGQQVASPLFSITDKAYVEGGMNICAFDSEGYAARDNQLIEKGQLQTLLHNSHTAKSLEAENTASASRGAKSSLDVAPRHKVIAVGSSSHAEVTGGEYLELVDLAGVHSGADAISGDFSFGASGFLCRDGKRVQPVRGITVAGNFYKMLNEIDAMGSVLETSQSRNFYAPVIRFSRLSIGGK